jgi:hypothetical protein
LITTAVRTSSYKYKIICSKLDESKSTSITRKFYPLLSFHLLWCLFTAMKLLFPMDWNGWTEVSGVRNWIPQYWMWNWFVCVFFAGSGNCDSHRT